MALPTITAAGALTLAEEHLAAMFAASTTFRKLVIPEDCDIPAEQQSEEAAKHIYIDALPPPQDEEDNYVDEYSATQLNELRPFLLISNPPRKFYRAERVATDTFADAGILIAWLEFTVPAACRNALDNPMRHTKNVVGKIIADLQQLSYSPGHLAIDRIEVDGPFRDDDDAAAGVGDGMAVQLTIYWNGGLAT